MNSEFQSLPPETQEAVKRTMDTMEPAQTPAEIRETLEGTQKGGVKNSIRNCLTVFQRDPLFRGALRLNLLTEQIDIVKPLGWERTSTTLTDMDMNYLLLYLEENYGLTSEKKVQSAIKIVANENRYHPVRDYLNSLQWDGTERIRYALHHFLGADTDEYTYEASKLDGNFSRADGEAVGSTALNAEYGTTLDRVLPDTWRAHWNRDDVSYYLTNFDGAEESAITEIADTLMKSN